MYPRSCLPFSLVVAKRGSPLHFISLHSFHQVPLCIFNPASRTLSECSMDSLYTSVDYDCVVVAAETEAVFDTHYFEDLVRRHCEEIQTADRLLKAAEDEYHPPRSLTPTEDYDNSLCYESGSESDLVRFAEEEQEDGLLQSGSLSPAVYYESMKSASVNEPVSMFAITSRCFLLSY